MTGLDQGVFAVREALADAGVDWADIQFAFGGSSAAGNADAALPRLGLTGVQFINVANGCATGGSSLLSGYWAIKSGEFDLGVVIGFDKHPRGAFNADPEASGLPRWYGETGMMLTTQFFAMKIRRYMDLYGISDDIARPGGREGVRERRARRRTPGGASRSASNTILSSQMVSDPLTKFMFCSPAEGGAALILASDKQDARAGPRPARKVRGAAVRTRVQRLVRGVLAVARRRARPVPDRRSPRRRPMRWPASGPADIDVAQIQDTESGAEIMHMAENGFCADGEQEQMAGRGRDAARRPPADQHRRRLPGLRRADRRLRPAPGL